MNNICSKWYNKKLILWTAIRIHLLWRKNRGKLIATRRSTKSQSRMIVWWIWTKIMRIMLILVISNLLPISRKYPTITTINLKNLKISPINKVWRRIRVGIPLLERINSNHLITMISNSLQINKTHSLLTLSYWISSTLIYNK